MSKMSFRGKPKKKSSSPKGGANPAAMMGQFQKMQEEMAAAQAALADETVTVTAGGGAVSITITGHQRIQTIEIEPDVVDLEDMEMLQDLLVAAVNQAIEQSQALAAERMEGLTGGLGLDDLLGGGL
jgi:nucleoid-associated protein EbfC